MPMSSLYLPVHRRRVVREVEELCTDFKPLIVVDEVCTSDLDFNPLPCAVVDTQILPTDELFAVVLSTAISVASMRLLAQSRRYATVLHVDVWRKIRRDV